MNIKKKLRKALTVAAFRLIKSRLYSGLFLSSFSTLIIAGAIPLDARIGAVSSESKICSEIGIGLLERGGVGSET